MKLGELIRPARTVRAGDTKYPLLSMTMRNGLVPQAAKFKKRVAGADLSQYKVVRNGQLVVGFPIDEAVLAFQRSIPSGIVSPAYAVWDVVDEAAVDRLYLERYLRSPIAIAYYLAKLQGSTARRRSLPNPIFLDMELALPPRDEQRRIAAALDKADELRAKRRQALAHLDTLTQSIFHSMFGDTAATATLGELCMDRFRNGVSPSTRGAIKQRVLTLSAITGASFDPTSVKLSTFEKPIPDTNRVLSTLFLICRGNGNRGLVGRGYFPREDLLDVGFPDTVIAAQPNLGVVVPLFLETAWSGQQARSQLEAAAKTTNGTFKINQSSLAGIKIPVPPLELQQTFATRVAAIERLKEAHRKHLTELDALFAALQYRAFRGEL